MQEHFWEQFTRTGKVEDYLCYKGISASERAINQYDRKETISESKYYGDRNDPVGDTDGRIR